jgi:anti-anti-sigma factor
MGKILVANEDGVKVLKLIGEVRVTLGPTISTFLDRIKTDQQLRGMVIDLTETTFLDSTALGMLAKVSLGVQERISRQPTIVTPNPDITRVLLSMGFEHIFVLVDDLGNTPSLMGEMPTQLVSEHVLREQVLEAHRVLMSLNQKNEEAFRDLVDALESEGTGRIEGSYKNKAAGAS